MLRSYAFASRFVGQARVLLVARAWGPGQERLLAGDPYLLWMPRASRSHGSGSWDSAFQAVQAMPSACVDRIIWFQDGGLDEPQEMQRWLVQLARVLDRNGTLMVRQSRPKLDATGEQGEDRFWELADCLHAEFPWVDVAAEVDWQASSITPVQVSEQGLGPLEVDNRLVGSKDPKCEAYWCLCALRREDRQAWQGPTLMLQDPGQDPQESALSFWAKQERAQQHCEDAARLMTAQLRVDSLRARLDELGQEREAWEQKERPDLLCKIVELQDRSMWLREQVVELEQRNVLNIEAKTRAQAKIEQMELQAKAQARSIRELSARVEALQRVSLAEQEPQEELAAPANDAPVLVLDRPIAAMPERTLPPKALAVMPERGLAPKVQALAASLRAVAPDDQQLIAPRAANADQGWSFSSWTERVRALRSKLGEQAPEFVTRVPGVAARKRNSGS